MAKPYSDELRARVQAAIGKGGSLRAIAGLTALCYTAAGHRRRTVVNFFRVAVRGTADIAGSIDQLTVFGSVTVCLLRKAVFVY